eukprot:CAMPEP_0170514912 /NCGR_PEP_ID=MMETSP0209-20121228/1424_1 /TAXON_ID=665100 ORGANISM="Litonotus pictus, Strain P1" /NCGR_SAMPLE_ID=MMETSP0209 /ASSEMBLY_ACC=CAM_ASM_000301 /LENGTH=276 /DNA_ID=CAMNT_0010799181 /DNA_START=77 /DNA_END=907 /DNA_ORIENTATION=+
MKVQEGYSILIEGSLKEEPEQGNLDDQALTQTKLQQEVIKRISNEMSKEKYQEIAKSYFLSGLVGKGDIKPQRGISTMKNIEDFPSIDSFNKVFLEKAFNTNKYILMSNLFCLFNQDNSTTSREESSKMFYKLLEGAFGEGKIQYSQLKQIFLEYLKVALVNPYEVVFLRSEEEEKRAEVRFIMENEFSETQRIEYLNYLLKNFEVLKLNSSHGDDFDKDYKNVSFEDFNFIVSDKNTWNWDIFKLRELYMLKMLSVYKKDSNGKEIERKSSIDRR